MAIDGQKSSMTVGDVAVRMRELITRMALLELYGVSCSLTSITFNNFNKIVCCARIILVYVTNCIVT